MGTSTSKEVKPTRCLQSRIEAIDRVRERVQGRHDGPLCFQQEAVHLNDYLVTARTQLERHGKPLTKPDLIAILLSLNKQFMDRTDALALMSVSELIALIRFEVYDPERFGVGDDAIDDDAADKDVNEDVDEDEGDNVVQLSLLEASHEAAVSLSALDDTATEADFDEVTRAHCKS